MRRGDVYAVPRSLARLAVGLRWAAATSTGDPVDFDVVGSCALLDACGSVLATLSAQNTTYSPAGSAVRFVPEPIFDFPPSLLLSSATFLMLCRW